MITTELLRVWVEKRMMMTMKKKKKTKINNTHDLSVERFEFFCSSIVHDLCIIEPSAIIRSYGNDVGGDEGVAVRCIDVSR
jgi:hypothetical protein